MKHEDKERKIDWKQIDTKGIAVQTQKMASAVGIVSCTIVQMMLKAGLAVLLACSISYAAPPKLSISVNRSAAVGTGITVNRDEPVTLELSTDATAKLAVFVVPKVNFDSTTNGRKVIFFAKQSVTFLVAAFGESGEITKSEYTITVSGTPVPPGPGPKPPDPPSPDLTPLGKAIYDATVKVVDPNRAATATSLAGVFRSAKSSAAADAKVTTGQQVVDITKTMLAQKFPDATVLRAWTGWQTAYKDAVAALKTKDEHLKAWVEIADGLEAAAKVGRAQ